MRRLFERFRKKPNKNVIQASAIAEVSTVDDIKFIQVFSQPDYDKHYVEMSSTHLLTDAEEFLFADEKRKPRIYRGQTSAQKDDIIIARKEGVESILIENGNEEILNKLAKNIALSLNEQILVIEAFNQFEEEKKKKRNKV